jgi:hypothetical protein
MTAAPEYSLATQAKFVPAMAALHNFIRIHDPNDIYLPEQEDHFEGPGAVVVPENLGGTISAVEKNHADDRRDSIAGNMWVQYQDYLQSSR